MTQIGSVYGEALYGLAKEENLSAVVLDELAVLEGVTPLEKLGKEEWTALLSALEVELVSRMGKSTRDRKRMLRCVELCRSLREAAFFNTNPGQLAGWLCAGIFE